jgi:hypothetical protein
MPMIGKPDTVDGAVAAASGAGFAGASAEAGKTAAPDLLETFLATKCPLDWHGNLLRAMLLRPARPWGSAP